MKFEKLYNLVIESTAKNKGGATFYAARQSDPTRTVNAGGGKTVGPIGASSVGRNDNPENVVPIPRWEFNPNEVGDIGSAIGSRLYSTMFSSFGLLVNDSTFEKNFNKLSEVFGERRAGYNFTKNVINYDEGTEEKVKYDYEKKLDDKEFMKAKRAEQVTELQSRLQHYNVRIRDWQKFKNSPLQKNRLKVVYVGLKATISEIEEQNKNSKNNKFFEIKQMYKDIETAQDKIKSLSHTLALTKSEESKKKIQKDIDVFINNIKKLNNTIDSNKFAKDLPEFKKYRKYLRKFNNIEDKYINSELDESTVNREAKEVLDLTSKLEEMEDSFNTISSELGDIYEFIDQINEINVEADSDAQAGFLHLVKTTAERLLNELNVKTPTNLQSLSQLDWNILPQNNQQKIERLEALTSEDPNTNPFIGYLNRFQMAYDNREYNAGLQLNKNTNITSLRDFERLPFSVIMKIYKGVAIKPIQLKTKEYDETKDDSWDVLSDYLKAFRGMKGDELFDSAVAPKFKTFESQEMIPILSGLKVRDVWANDKSKDFIKRWINETGLPESFKTRHIIAATPKLMFTSRTGANSFFQLWSALDSDIRGTKAKKESFDKLFDKLISEKVWDDDDFKLDTMEILSYYK